MNLAIDYGNSLIKAGLFTSYELQERREMVTWEDLKELIAKLQPEQTIIGSVAERPESILKRFPGENVLVLTAHTPLPFTIKYATPETLGADRLAAIAGAQLRFPQQNSLVIDIGTCITYDILTQENEYLGGAISPGLDMKLRALHEFTAQLPLVGMENDVELIGDSTKNSILSGVVIGSEAEMREIIRMYCDKFPDLRIIVCGGGSKYFESRLSESVTYAPDLVLEGLNSILKHNVR